jgi:hypothetical protein
MAVCRSVATLLLGIVTTGCGPKEMYVSAPLAGYDLYKPLAYVTPSHGLVIELERAAYVTVISVAASPDDPPEEPVLFVPWYPANYGEQSYMTAGRHRLRHVPPPELAPRDCSPEETPTLEGCRRPVWRSSPGGSPVRWQPQSRNRYNYFLVVTQSAVDPYVLADDLFKATRGNEELARLLRSHDARAAAPALERALFDRRGPIVLAGAYVTRQLDWVENR